MNPETLEARETVDSILRELTHEEIIENRRNLSTRKQYVSRIKRMARVIAELFPEITDLVGEDNWLKRPVPQNALKALIDEFNERGNEQLAKLNLCRLLLLVGSWPLSSTGTREVTRCVLRILIGSRFLL
jgi:hypothetical protein